ncbi:hypothetical protein ACFL6C_11065 [Myxococcota bacterium]
MTTEIQCRFRQEMDHDSEEHIVLDSLGGKRTVTGIIGRRVNNELGKAIDAPFEEALRPLSILLGARRGDGKPVAPLRRLETADGTQINISSGGFPELSRRGQVEPLETSDASKRFSVHANTIEKAIELVAHQLKRFDGDVSKIQDLRIDDISKSAGRVQLNTSLGGAIHGRTVSKMGFMALARAFGRNFIDASSLDDAVQFIVNGDEDSPRHTMVPERRTELRAAIGGAVGTHTLATFDVTEGCCAVFLAFGVAPFWVRLSDQSLGLETAIVHHVEPVENTHTVEDRKVSLPDAQYSLSDESITHMAPALEELAGHAASIQLDLWREYVVERAIEPLRALPEGTIFTKEHLDQVITLVTDAMELRLLGGEKRRPVANDALQEQVAAKLEEIRKSKRP